MARRRTALTTGQVAEYCQVRPATVFNWIKEGKLKAYSTPGGHYRVRLEDFRGFLIRYSMPVDEDFFSSPGNRILIVDDEPSVVEFIEKALSDEGYRFASAADGYEAGLKVASFQPALVILDLLMPRVDGFEVCRKIKSTPQTRGIKILVITGYPDDENVKRARECGADDILIKPLRVEELRKTIRGLISRVAMRAVAM